MPEKTEEILDFESTIKKRTGQREKIRALLWVYDALFLLAVWFFVLVLHPSVSYAIPTDSLIFSLLLSFVFYSAARLFFRVYKQILRYGSVSAYAREIAADIVASGVFLSAVRVLPVFRMPFTSAVSFCGTYAVLCLLFRIAYFYLYRFVQLDNPVCRSLKQIMIRLTLVDFDSTEEGGLMRLVLEPDVSAASPINEIQNVVDKFAIRGDVTSIAQIKKGYINRTYRVETLSDAGHVHKYTLQRINTNVFPDVNALMANFRLTTDHLHGKLLLPGHGKKGSVQMIRPTKDGRSFFQDDSGCWRMLTYFDGVYSLDIPDSPQTFYYAGKAFGQFVREMADVDLDDIQTVIPNFHNTLSRYRNLESVIAKDPKGRAKDVQREIAFVRARARCYGIISDALDSGAIPTRICHNDCNLNNILFDDASHLPVAIIDLDTVMPSSPLYDYGDSMRIGTNTAKDDEKDLSKVSCDLNLYRQYARGYLEECGDMLTRKELELLPFASLVITSEDGIRFLMDHIDGDTYYNIYYPGQNLDRSRTQLALLRDMERKLPQIVEILQQIYTELKLDVRLDTKAIMKQWMVEER